MRVGGYDGILPGCFPALQAHAWLGDSGFSLMPIGRLFISEGYAKQRLLAERFAHDLHADR